LDMNNAAETFSTSAVGDVTPTYASFELATFVGRGYVPDGRQ